jgi:hypothetical protein
VSACAALMVPSSASATTYLSGGLNPGGGTEYSLAFWDQNSMGNSNSPYAGYQVHLRFRWYSGSESQHMYTTMLTAYQNRQLNSWSWPGCWRTISNGGTGYYTGYWCAAS